MPNLLIGLFLGIIIGVLTHQYIFPYLDILFEIFVSKSSEIITEHNLNIQMLSCDLLREYPELNNDGNFSNEPTGVIGFQYNSSDDEEYYGEDDIKLNNKKLKYNYKRSK